MFLAYGINLSNQAHRHSIALLCVKYQLSNLRSAIINNININNASIIVSK